jgi:hypothetical protein
MVLPSVYGLKRVVFFLLISLFASGLQTQGNKQERSVLNSPVDANMVVRFFYEPGESYFHVPLILRSIGEKDSRMNTVSIEVEGRTVFDSEGELTQLMRGLARSDLSWQESENVEPLGPFKQLHISDYMEVFVANSKGTAKSKIGSKDICRELGALDPALKTPRVLWELQGFRLNYGCKVPGFKKGAYPS